MYDAIILGGGPAGLSAALYARRYGLGVLLLEGLYLGGQIVNTHAIENYPGFPEPLAGGGLADKFEEQARAHGAEIVYENATGLGLSGGVKTVVTAKREYQARCIIAATGCSPRELGLPREKGLRGLGVSYCATCDGNFFKGKDVAVVGGGDTAVMEAVFLSRICRNVSIIHRRGSFRAAKAETDKLQTAKNVHLLMNSRVTGLLGDKSVNGIVVAGDDECERELELSAVFVAVGAIPNTQLFEGKLDLDEQGFIITDEEMKTSAPGVFAAGDVRRKTLRQVITAASDGAIAAYGVMAGG